MVRLLLVRLLLVQLLVGLRCRPSTAASSTTWLSSGGWLLGLSSSCWLSSSWLWSLCWSGDLCRLYVSYGDCCHCCCELFDDRCVSLVGRGDVWV